MAVDQIKDMGMGTVLIGHSERRGEFGLPTPAESCELMATKLQRAPAPGSDPSARVEEAVSAHTSLERPSACVEEALATYPSLA